MNQGSPTGFSEPQDCPGRPVHPMQRDGVQHLRVRPVRSLRGDYRLPGDKSISHRALLLGALSVGATDVQGFLPAADCLASLRCVRGLGVRVDELSATHLIVHGRGPDGLREPEDVLDCGGSGTTMRLLAGILAAQPFFSVLTGNAQLRRRPMDRVATPLRLMGAVVQGRSAGRLPPLCIAGRRLTGIDYRLPVASAQVKSAILLAGLWAATPTTVHEPGPARDHTERMLRARGAALECDGCGTVFLTPGQELRATDVVVPADMSSAAFLMVAACLTPDSEITLHDVGVNPTRSGILDVLLEMGADITLSGQREIGGEPLADMVARSSGLRAVEVGGAIIPRLIDEIPILALAATQAEGRTIIRDAAELRVKETDRIETTAAELRRLGAHIETRPDGLLIEGPTPLHGAQVNSHGDHRLAMTLAVAGLIAAGETLVEDTACIADSFPGFEDVLQEATETHAHD